MSKDHYDGPVIRVSLTATAERASAKYEWRVKIAAPDHKGEVKLGYKAKGQLADLSSPVEDFDIKVRDKARDVWTSMPLGDRKDIRDRIKLFVRDAAAAAKANGYS